MAVRLLPPGAIQMLLPVAALAHTGGATAEGFSAGFLHPLLGPDHMIAMVAVGLWGAQLGSPAIWLLPITFPLMMALGGAAAGLGLAVPGVEIGIAVSALLLGSMVATAARPALPVALLLVGIFGVLHGHAHGTELPEATDPLAYGLGFVIATGLLHLAGILLGLLNLRPFGVAVVRLCGAAIALTGGWYLAMRLGALA